MTLRLANRGRFCSKSCRAKWQHSSTVSAFTRKKYGADNPNYRHGLSTRKDGKPGRVALPPKTLSAVYDAIKRGDLVRGACEVCGSTRVHAHHDDYNEPLKIRWLCPSHHAKVHKAMREATGVARVSPLRVARSCEHNCALIAEWAFYRAGTAFATAEAAAGLLSDYGVRLVTTCVLKHLRFLRSAGLIQRLPHIGRSGPRWMFQA